jgi:hypothetical protein
MLIIVVQASTPMVVVAALSLISGLGVLAIFLYTRRTNQAMPYITLLTNQSPCLKHLKSAHPTRSFGLGD